MRLAARYQSICPALLVLAIVGAPRPARARPAVVATQLDYDAAPGCPGAARFAAVVIGRLGRFPAGLLQTKIAQAEMPVGTPADRPVILALVLIDG